MDFEGQLYMALTLWQGLLHAAAAQRPGLFLISVMASLENRPFMAPTGAANDDLSDKCCPAGC